MWDQLFINKYYIFLGFLKKKIEFHSGYVESLGLWIPGQPGKMGQV
jgi:hypothetical protein